MDDQLIVGQTPEDVRHCQSLAKSARRDAWVVSQMLKRIQRAKLFGPNRDTERPQDSVAVQILFKMAAQVEKVEQAQLTEDETELDRQAKVFSCLKAMGDFTRDMLTTGARTLDRAAKQNAEAARLMLADKHFKAKLETIAGKTIDALSDSELLVITEEPPDVRSP